MFQSYSCKHLNFDQKSQKYNYEITIVDENFQETVPDLASARGTPSRPAVFLEAVSVMVIEIYSKRNLNVSKNLVAYMKYIKIQYGSYYNFEKQISWYKKGVEDFDKYLPEIEKYLMME